jgi:hypothetical protein
MLGLENALQTDNIPRHFPVRCFNRLNTSLTFDISESQSSIPHYEIRSTMEARMPARLATLLIFLLPIPAVCQRGSVQARVNQSIAQQQQQLNQLPPPAALDVRTARIEAVQQDANELSALSASIQSDLLKLQSGVFVKDLNDNLKKMEKLSKKLRKEME